MTKLGFFIFVVFVISVLTFLALLFLDLKGDPSVRKPETTTEQVQEVPDGAG